MKTALSAFLLTLSTFLIMSCSGEKADESASQSPQQMASGITTVVPAGAQLEKIAVDYAFDTAGLPCWSNGELYFTNNIFDPRENSRTMKLDANGNHSIVREDNGVTTCSYATGRGTFYCCEMVGHRVSEMAADGSIVKTVAGEFNGKRLDGPNDMTLDAKGGFYFTDSQYPPDDLMQEEPCVYYVAADGAISRVIVGITFPNGLELSPDEKTLYVVNTKDESDKGSTVWAFDVNSDGTVSNKRAFAALELSAENAAKADGVSGADGTAMDVAGNLYVATTQGVGIQVFDKAGAYLGNIPCPTACNNLSFGGSDMKTLYVSAKDGVYSMQMKVAGKIQGHQ